MEDAAFKLVNVGLGTLVAYLIAFTVRKVRERRLRAKYPVAGRFITVYEDAVSGVEVVQKAMTTLEQKGREISGKTIDIEDGRAWRLKGKIEDGGFLHGVYDAEDPNDPGEGTFFMKIEGPGKDLRGLWAGFDSANGEIDSGRYEFKRCPEAMIQPASDADASSVSALLGDALGELYVDLDDVRSTISSDNAEATCLIAVDPKRQIIGALIVARVDRVSIGGVLPKGQSEKVQRLPAIRYHERICLIRSIAVVPSWRGRGVGSQLVREALEWCRKQGATTVMSFGWKSSQGCHIDGVMATTGFQSISEISNFWTEDSKSRDYLCPECGAVCKCTAVVFRRAVESRAAFTPR